jgi:hypothetical protein
VKAKLDSSPSAAQRVAKGGYQDYVHLEMKGDIGGPTLGSGDFVYAQEKKMLSRVGRFGSIPSTLDSEPPAFNTGLEKESIQIVAASPDYMVLGKFRQAGDPDRSDLHVHDIKAGVWKDLRVPGLTSRHRLFGSWLASIIEHPRQPPPAPGSTVVIDPGKLPANPGHSDERAGDGRSLPNVQELFMGNEARISIIPGILELNNLGDGRRIVIETGEEDSEVILVTVDGIVLYRVNDSIYRARVQGSALSSPALFVKDDHVPEVNWAFMSSN